MRNESTDAVIKFMRGVIERYDNSEDVIDTFELSYERIPPKGGLNFSFRKDGIYTELRMSYFISQQTLDAQEEIVK